MPLSTDELLGFLLISTWSLTTGRQLRCDVPPEELTEQELIDFWADDQLWPAIGVGRSLCAVPVNLRGKRS
jgi:hypothetical protein